MAGTLISLGAIDFGLVVDGAIIIVENALRRLAERQRELGRALTDEERTSVVSLAAREVRSATAFGEAIIALVYVPIVALQSVEGRMFRPMALTVLFALATAFVLSLTVVPALASLALPRDATDRQSPVIRGAMWMYRPALEWALHRPKLVVLGTAVAFFASLVLGSSMGREFLPKLDEGTIISEMVRLPSVSLEQSLDQTRQVEKALLAFPEVKSVVCRTGRAEVAVDPMGINMSDVYVLLRPKKEWKTAKDRDSLVEAFDATLRDAVPGAGFSYTQPIEMSTSELLAGIQSDLALHLYGHDLTLLRRTADRIVRALRAIAGARDVRAEQIAGLNVLTAEVDRAAIGRYGLDARTVLDTVAALGGVQVGDVFDGPARERGHHRRATDSHAEPRAGSPGSARPHRSRSGSLDDQPRPAAAAHHGPAQRARSRHRELRHRSEAEARPRRRAADRLLCGVGR